MKKIIYQASYYTFSLALQKGLIFFLIIYLASHFSPENYAQWSILYAIQTAFFSFMSVGLFESIISMTKDLKVKKQKEDIISSVNFITSSIFLVLLIISLIYYFYLSKLDSNIYIFLCVIGIGSLSSVLNLHANIIRLQGQHFLSLLFSFAPPFFSVLISLIFVIKSSEISLYYPIAFASISCIAFVLVYIRRSQFYINFSSIYTKKIFKRTMPFMLIAFLSWLTGYGLVLIADFFLPKVAIARYALLLTLSSSIEVLATSLNKAWNPRYIAMISSKSSQFINSKATRFYSSLTLLLSFISFILLLSVDKLLLLIGKNIALYSYVKIDLFLLLTALIISIPWWQCVHYYYVYNRGKDLSKIILKTGIITIPLAIILMKLSVPYAIYITYLLERIFRTFVIYSSSKKFWDIVIPFKTTIIAISILSLSLFIN